MLKDFIKDREFSHPLIQTKSPTQVIHDSAIKANGGSLTGTYQRGINK